MKPVLVAPLLVLLASAPAAQWDPAGGSWGKADADYVRVMTWNVKDGICSTNHKDVATNNWAAAVRIVAALQPDVLCLQETGDNQGNGTGGHDDSVSVLLGALDLFLHGGFDVVNQVQVTEYVQKYAPGYDLPWAFASLDGDGFNRNATLSRYPFVDLNGDGTATLPDIPTVLGGGYVQQGGTIEPRGTPWTEIDLPDGTYTGDLVVGNSHLKAGSSSGDKNTRIWSGQRLAYFTYHFWHGAGTGVPDPDGRILDSPPAQTVLGPATTVVHAGDFNDASYPAEDGVLWSSRAEFATGFGAPDGPDAGGDDMQVDLALDPFTFSKGTWGSVKLDYVTWEGSKASAANAFVFNTATLPPGALPPELATFFAPPSASSIASDHRPVVLDLDLASSFDDCNQNGVDDALEPDTDGDGTIDECDNCPLPNPDQADVNTNGIGDACEQTFCRPTFGDAGAPALTVCGDAFDVDVALLIAPAASPAWLAVGLAKLPVPLPLLPGSDLILVTPDFLIPFTTSGTGALTNLGSVTGGMGPASTTVFLQAAVWNAAVPEFVTSNGVELELFH